MPIDPTTIDQLTKLADDLAGIRQKAKDAIALVVTQSGYDDRAVHKAEHVNGYLELVDDALDQLMRRVRELPITPAS